MTKLLLYAISGALGICIYSIIQAPNYDSANYAEWNIMGYSNKQAREQFEPFRRDWLPRVI
jgi:hypothetical protein